MFYAAEDITTLYTPSIKTDYYDDRNFITRLLYKLTVSVFLLFDILYKLRFDNFC